MTTNTSLRQCPECARQNLYSTQTNSGGGYGPMLLPGLGGFLRTATFEVVVCADCGLTRFYASAEAREKLATNINWRRA